MLGRMSEVDAYPGGPTRAYGWRRRFTLPLNSLSRLVSELGYPFDSDLNSEHKGVN